MNVLMRYVILPNVLAMFFAQWTAVITQNLYASLLALVCGYIGGLRLGRWLYKDNKRG